MTHWLMAVLMAVAAMVPSASALDSTAKVHGNGSWKTDGRSARPAQNWNLDVIRGTDDSIRGRVTVSDSPLLSSGNVEGKVSGRSVKGTISDDDGNVIATFEGDISATGLSGKYKDRTGELGTWSWNGQVPQLQ